MVRFMTGAALACALTVTAGSMTAARRKQGPAPRLGPADYLGGSIGTVIPRD